MIKWHARKLDNIFCKDKSIDAKKIDKIPIQMQFYYDSLDGARHMRLLVQHVKVTNDEELFEKSTNNKLKSSFFSSYLLYYSILKKNSTLNTKT